MFYIDICEAIRQILFFLIKQCITLKSDIILLNTFPNQTYILAVFNEKASKVILFWKINRFLRSTTQGSIHRDLIKKNYNYITRFKFWSSLYSLLMLTCTPFKSNAYQGQRTSSSILIKCVFVLCAVSFQFLIK